MLSDRIHRKATERFISQNQTVIYIDRAERVSDGAGGFIDGTVRMKDPVSCRLVGVGTQRADHHRVSEVGALRAPSVKMIASDSADVLPGDEFEVDSVRYEVLSINRNPPWRLEAEVFIHG